jgi:hypothetical protein
MKLFYLHPITRAYTLRASIDLINPSIDEFDCCVNCTGLKNWAALKPSDDFILTSLTVKKQHPSKRASHVFDTHATCLRVAGCPHRMGGVAVRSASTQIAHEARSAVAAECEHVISATSARLGAQAKPCE